MGTDDESSTTASPAEPAGRAAGGEPGAPHTGGAPDGDAAGGGEPPSAPGGRSKTRSRRFPVLTRDTARPEGGGRAAPGDAPAPARQWPMLLVATGVLAGLLLTLVSFRAGTLTVGLTLLGAAGLRWASPAVGMLAVRSRFTDVLTYAVLGFAITLLAMMAQPGPWVTIPFLDDIVHFTVR